MTESEYSEENLDDFMIKASNILWEENNSNQEKELIINSLKEHLDSIYQDKSEMENFFKTLNYIIFSQSNKEQNKIINSKPFKLYPIIFAFNPKNAYYYVDYFLTSLQMSVSCEDNNQELSYLITIFSEVIKVFFGNNNNKIKKNYLLEKNKINKLYEKFYSFCNNNIKSEKKLEQSFGCLLLTEFVEKCPLIKEQKNFENIFKLICDNLEDNWFKSKLDLLNCTISLIFISGKNFKNYANVCLFKILDFLTDEDWMKKKLAINIVYTLAFYCKEEIIKVKDNIIDFLSALKDDPVDEVKEICIKTLNYVDECDNTNNNNLKNNNSNKKVKEKENSKDNKAIEERKNNEDNNNKEIKNNTNLFNLEINIKNKEMNEKYGNTMDLIFNQIKKIQDTQYILNNMLNNVKETIDTNYTNLNERLKVLENKLDKRNILFNKKIS